MSDTQRLRERFWAFFKQNHQCLSAFAGSQKTSDYPAKDLLQDAFLFAWERLDPARCDRWLAWLCIIIRRLKLDRHRRRATSPVVLAGDIETDENADLMVNAAGDALSPGELAKQLGDAQLVKQALARLKIKHQRRVLELYYFDAGNYPTLSEVADAMGISLAKAKKLHERAKNALQHSLRELAKEMHIPTEKPNHEP